MNNNEVNLVGNGNQNVKKTNIIAIVGFIFSFLFALVGLILSIIGLKKSKELNSGKGLSIAGIIISSLSLIFGFTIFYVVFLIINEALYMSDKSGITNKVYCSQSYDCVKSSAGWSCKYKGSDGKEYQITCDQNNNVNNNNDNNNVNTISKEDIIGIWEVETVMDSYGNEINPSNYFGWSASMNYDNYFTLYSDGRYENYLSIYGDENEVTGTFKINNDKIYLTNKYNNTTYMDYEITSNNDLILKLYDGDMIICLIKSDFSSNTTNYQTYKTGYENGQEVLAKEFILDETGNLYATLNKNYPEFNVLNLSEEKIKGTELNGFYIMTNVKKFVSFEIGNAGFTYEFVLSNDGKVYYIYNGASDGISFIKKEISEFYGIEDFYRDEDTNEICLKKNNEIRVLDANQLLSYTNID